MPSSGAQSISEFSATDLDGFYLYSLPRFTARAEQRLGIPRVNSLEQLPKAARGLVVLGGGALMDAAKLWRLHERPELRLVAIPSLWGSGAEASRVVALNRDGQKWIEVDDALVPDLRVEWPELAAELPAWRAQEACGDAWSHAIEGFLSPLATDELRTHIAGLMQTMLGLPLAADAAWFEVSALASAAQGQASVGLVHGIAHTLEGPLSELSSERPFGHARLCSIYLKPVIALGRSLSPKFDDYTAAAGLDGAAILGVFDKLFDRAAFEATLPALEQHWRGVLRDPCSRTNSALVRPAQLCFFTEGAF